MRALCFMNLMAAILLAGQAGSADYRLEVIQRIPAAAARERGLHRVAVCPDGTWVITHNSGSATVVDAGGSVRFSGSGLEALAEVTASTCDAANQLWTGGAGTIRRFEISSSGEPRLQQTIRAGGGANRILAAGDQLYLLGLARINEKHVILRRFSLRDGAPAGVIPVDLPVWSGKTVNQLVLNGSLFIAGQDLIYVPANPFEFWRFDRDGRRLEVKRPKLPHFENADLDGLRLGPARPPRSFDWAFNALPLPDGRIVVQLMKGTDPERPPATTAPNNFLAVFDSNLELLAGNVPADGIGTAALMIGSDSSGNLCFSDLSVSGSSSLIKARLVNR